MDVVCRRADQADDIAKCLHIRELVFIDEQNVPAELERDGFDDSCIHYLAALNGEMIGTARVMILDDKFKFQRVAVLPSARGAGIGGKLMNFMMSDLAKRADHDGKRFFLSSQVDAIPFYERLGFVICSEEYLDAGIRHRDMVRAI